MLIFGSEVSRLLLISECDDQLLSRHNLHTESSGASTENAAHSKIPQAYSPK